MILCRRSAALSPVDGGCEQGDIHEDALLASLALGHGPVLREAAGQIGEELSILAHGSGRVDVDGTSRELEGAVVVLLDQPL